MAVQALICPWGYLAKVWGFQAVLGLPAAFRRALWRLTRSVLVIGLSPTGGLPIRAFVSAGGFVTGGGFVTVTGGFVSVETGIFVSGFVTALACRRTSRACCNLSSLPMAEQSCRDQWRLPQTRHLGASMARHYSREFKCTSPIGR